MSKRITSFAFTTLRSLSTSKFGTTTAYRRSELGSPGFAFEAHHADFLDGGRLQVVRFDLLGINVLSVGRGR